MADNRPTVTISVRNDDLFWRARLVSFDLWSLKSIWVGE